MAKLETVNLETAYDPINVFDLEKLAAQKLPTLAFDYFASGACDERTLAANISAYQEIWLRPKMLVDVSDRHLDTTVLGTNISAPILVAPMAFQCMADPEGEIATAKAVARFGTVMAVSTLSNYSMEEVAAATDAHLWFQLYVYKDRGITRDLVQRAEAAGCTALVITVDSPLLGRREKDVRNKFNLPEHLRCGNLANAAGMQNLPHDSKDSGLAVYIASLYDTSLTWKDLVWLKSITKLPVAVKGILRGDDAVRAIECGATAIIVSNHGGRQLDTAVPTIKALPEVVKAVAGQAEVYVDGGIRRGTDIIKAIAFGARAVLVGRPILWGLAVAGETGALTVLDMLRGELDLAMALSGCRTIGDITADLLCIEKS